MLEQLLTVHHARESVLPDLVSDLFVLLRLRPPSAHEACGELGLHLLNFDAELLLQLVEFVPDRLDLLVLRLELLLLLDEHGDKFLVDLSLIRLCKAGLHIKKSVHFLFLGLFLGF